MDFIAEIGSNWYSESKPGLEGALDAITQSAGSGATAAKFQIYRADKLYREGHPARQSLKKYNLPYEWLKPIKGLCDAFGIKLWASVFDIESAKQAWPYIDVCKIASGDLTNANLARAIGGLKAKPICISTGAATIDEVRVAYDFTWNFISDPLVMNCSSKYPATIYDYNLLWIMDDDAGVLCLSDHTKDNALGAAAVAKGYTVFEKHIKFDFTSPDCPDYGHSLTAAEFANYVTTLKAIDKAVSNNGKPQTDFDERIGARRGKDGLRPNVS